MKVRRHGTFANHGWSDIEIKCKSVRWDPEKHCIVISDAKVKSFDYKSNHNYEIHVSNTDMEAILNSLSNGGAKNDWCGVEKYVSGFSRILHRLLNISSGIYPSVMPESKGKTPLVNLKE